MQTARLVPTSLLIAALAAVPLPASANAPAHRDTWRTAAPMGRRR